MKKITIAICAACTTGFLISPVFAQMSPNLGAGVINCINKDQIQDFRKNNASQLVNESISKTLPAPGPGQHKWTVLFNKLNTESDKNSQLWLAEYDGGNKIKISPYIDGEKGDYDGKYYNITCEYKDSTNSTVATASKLGAAPCKIMPNSAGGPSTAVTCSKFLS